MIYLQNRKMSDLNDINDSGYSYKDRLFKKYWNCLVYNDSSSNLIMMIYAYTV